MGDQFGTHGISVHVVKLLLKFGLRVNVEIIVAALPESPQPLLLFRKGKGQLASGVALAGAQGAGDALFENLHNFCRGDVAGFAEQQVDVLGHQDVTDQREAVASPHLIEYSHGQIPGARAAQQGAAMKAAKSYEVQVAEAGDPPEILGHAGEERVILCKKRDGEPPEVR